MAGKRVKAATKANKAKSKVKGTLRALSPSGVADALGDYLLPKSGKKGGAKTVKAKKMKNGRN